MNKKDKAKIQAMDQYSEDYDDLPDGAFFALAEDMFGWDVDDWVWHEEVTTKKTPQEIKGEKEYNKMIEKHLNL